VLVAQVRVFLQRFTDDSLEGCKWTFRQVFINRSNPGSEISASIPSVLENSLITLPPTRT
jgi:hypothetical protein